jgi:hypothetical protein
MSPLLYRITADLVVTVHFGFVAFVVFGQLAILVGLIRKWSWVRNLTFRVLHLIAISIVVVQAVMGVMCPLTVWEQELRKLAGQATYSGDFIPNLLHDWLFYDAEGWVFTACYVTFGALVLLTFFAGPPRLPKQSKPEP